ncbi:hypothetical protein LTR84_004193 [Exophiala bonariae]|uniref:Protein BIG1 n=1 Tax=Exophiala bonariae TaxID=1690606 RepID=A0AAV9N6Q7_9EURO|nr:hypothetical protein LTR84_004193 [Exophiala bonariae]
MKFQTFIAATTAAGYLSGMAVAQEVESIPSPPQRHSPIASLLPGAEALTLETWRSQLGLEEQPLQPAEHWIYLSGRETCNGTENVCTSFDDAMAKGYHVLRAQAHDKQKATPPVHFSYIDCDQEPILCHSWLLKPPAIMHIDVDATAEIPILLRPMRIAPSNKTAEDRYADTTPASARKVISPIVNGVRPPSDFHVWDGLMNPFTGHLGKLGLNVPWGWWSHHYGWVQLPISWHAFCMIILVVCRGMVWQLTPKQNQSAAEMVIKPGVLGFDGDSVLNGEAGEEEGDEDGDGQGGEVKKEDKKDQ